MRNYYQCLFDCTINRINSVFNWNTSTNQHRNDKLTNFMRSWTLGTFTNSIPMDYMFHTSTKGRKKSKSAKGKILLLWWWGTGRLVKKFLLVIRMHSFNHHTYQSCHSLWGSNPSLDCLNQDGKKVNFWNEPQRRPYTMFINFPLSQNSHSLRAFSQFLRTAENGSWLSDQVKTGEEITENR